MKISGSEMCYCERQRYTFPRQIYTLIQSAHTTKKSTEECSKKNWAESHPLCPLPVQHIHTTHLVWHTDCTEKGVFPLLRLFASARVREWVSDSGWVIVCFAICLRCDVTWIERRIFPKVNAKRKPCDIIKRWFELYGTRVTINAPWILNYWAICCV